MCGVKLYSLKHGSILQTLHDSLKGSKCNLHVHWLISLHRNSSSWFTKRGFKRQLYDHLFRRQTTRTWERGGPTPWPGTPPEDGGLQWAVGAAWFRTCTPGLHTRLRQIAHSSFLCAPWGGPTPGKPRVSFLRRMVLAGTNKGGRKFPA